MAFSHTRLSNNRSVIVNVREEQLHGSLLHKLVRDAGRPTAFTGGEAARRAQGTVTDRSGALLTAKGGEEARKRPPDRHFFTHYFLLPED